MKQGSKLPKKSTERATGGFLSGVLVLSISTVFVKIIGLAYKIPMMALLGAEGMGYFNSAMEIFAVLCVIATAGLPVALSMMISAQSELGRSDEIRRIYRAALTLFLCLGFVGSGCLILFARPISILIGNEAAYHCILAVAPALFAVCVSGGIRGYFQGLQQMGATAVSQMIEALGKLIFGVWFGWIAVKLGYSIPIVAAYAIGGVVLGTLLSMLFLLLMKSRKKGQVKKVKQWDRKLYGELLRIAIPITLGAFLLSLTKLMDMTLMMHRLRDIGYSLGQANAVFGSYTTLAVPVFSLIPSLITPIGLVLVPSLSAAIEREDREGQAELTNDSIRLTVLLGMPSSLGIAVFSKDILSLLFPREGEAVEVAAPLLAILGGSILFSGLITTTNGILQAYRRPNLPIFSMLVGVLVKGISAYFLLGLPSVGAYGAPISTFLCNVCITGLNLFFVEKNVPKSPKKQGIVRLYGKPLIASVGAIVFAIFSYLLILQLFDEPLWSFLGAVLVAVMTYIIFVFGMKIITVSELRLLVRGRKNHSL